MLKKETPTYRYTIDDGFTLRVWFKEAPEDVPPFLEQPFNPTTGVKFGSVEDAEQYFNSLYSEPTPEE